MPGTGGTVPHRSQVNWVFQREPYKGRTTIIVDGKQYYIGHGNPGLGLDLDGEENNCLIDSLRQCIGVKCSRIAVRRDLVARHQHDPGRAKVTLNSYLDVEDHWRTILGSIFLHQTDGESDTFDTEDYCVIGLYRQGDNGVVLGNLSARYRLVVMNTDDVHFDPCLPM